MSTSQIKALEDFILLQNRNALSHAIRAGVELGVLTALRDGQRTVEQLAEELSVQPKPLSELMQVLVATELIEQYGDDFALSTIARLVPAPFLDFGDRYWEHLSDYVRSGVALPADEAKPHNDVDFVINKATEEWTLTPAALDAAKILDIGKSRRGLRILEIGCGSAVFGITVAHSDPDSVLNLLDDAQGLARARATVESVELHKQVLMYETPEPINIDSVPELKDELFDLIIVAGIIHRLSQAECERLLAQLSKHVKPEREIAIVDIFPGQPEGETSRKIFELELGLRTSVGTLHDPTELTATMKGAGFLNVQYAHLPSAPFYWGLLLGTK